MRTIRKIFSCLCLTLSIAFLAEGKPWRGIVPLHSTRADVERLLGRSDGVSSAVYKLENESVFVQYAGAPCESDEAYGWNVPRDTVINISVSLRVLPRLADLQLDLSRYARKKDPEVGSYTYYIDEEAGITYDVSNGSVTAINYGPTRADGYLRCACSHSKNHSQSDVQPCRAGAQSASIVGEQPKSSPVVSEGTYHRVLDTLFPPDASAADKPVWSVVLRFKPSFKPESQIVIRRGEKSSEVIEYTSPDGSIYDKLNDMLARSGKEDAAEMAKAIRVKRRAVSVPYAQVKLWYANLLDGINGATKTLKEAVEEFDRTGDESFVPDGTVYDLWYEHLLNKMSFSLYDAEVDTPDSDGEFKLVQWMNAVRRDVEKLSQAQINQSKFVSPKAVVGHIGSINRQSLEGVYFGESVDQSERRAWLLRLDPNNGKGVLLMAPNNLELTEVKLGAGAEISFRSETAPGDVVYTFEGQVVSNAIRGTFHVVSKQTSPPKEIGSAAVVLKRIESDSLSPDGRNINGLYSNVKYNEEAGDLTGKDLILLPLEERLTAIFISYEDEMIPYAANIIRSGDKVRFSVQTKNGVESYVGLLSEGKLSLRRNDHDADPTLKPSVLLKKRGSLQQPHLQLFKTSSVRSK